MCKFAVLVLILGFVNTFANAETYRCRNSEGTLVFTDDPARFPPGCRPEEKKDGNGTLSVVPSPSAPPAPARAAEKQPMRQKGADQAKEWKEEAQKLASEYQETLTQRYQVMPAGEKREVIGRIGEIKKRRDELRRQIAGGTLSRRERAEIEEVLAGIPP